MNKKIGLIGEDPNDTDSLKNLLLQKYAGKVSFIQLLRNKRGHQLENSRTREALKIEYREKKPNLIVCIRDADAIITERDKIKKRIVWHHELLKGLNGSLLLLNIYELESLILADIDTFNKLYGTTLKFPGDIHYKKEPKEYLIHATRKNRKVYRESHCPEVFEKLSIDKISKKSTVFRSFLKQFDDFVLA